MSPTDTHIFHSPTKYAKDALSNMAHESFKKCVSMTCVSTGGFRVLQSHASMTSFTVTLRRPLCLLTQKYKGTFKLDNIRRHQHKRKIITVSPIRTYSRTEKAARM